MNDSGPKQKAENAAVAWFAKFGRLDPLDWLTILLAALFGTLVKKHHFPVFPDWFLDCVLPFLLIVAGYSKRRTITDALETGRKNERRGSGE
jgi:hypothetical protein